MKDDAAYEGLDEEALSQIVAYSDGEMSPDDERAFELRLDREPALARAVERFMDQDAQLALSGLASESGGGRLLPWKPLVAVAAALTLVFVVSNPWQRSVAGPSIGLIAASDGPAELSSLDPSLGLQRLEWAQDLRGSGGVTEGERSLLTTRGMLEQLEQTGVVSDLTRRILGGVSSVQDQRREERATASDSLQSNFFRVIVRLNEPRTVLVFRFTKMRGEEGVERVFPDPILDRSQPSLARLEVGAFTLPAPPVQPGPKGSGTFRFTRGFVVPRGVDEMPVIVASHPGLPQDLLSSVDLALPDLSLEKLREYLDEHGFEVSEFVVRKEAGGQGD